MKCLSSSLRVHQWSMFRIKIVMKWRGWVDVQISDANFLFPGFLSRFCIFNKDQPINYRTTNSQHKVQKQSQSIHIRPLHAAEFIGSWSRNVGFPWGEIVFDTKLGALKSLEVNSLSSSPWQSRVLLLSPVSSSLQEKMLKENATN